MRRLQRSWAVRLAGDAADDQGLLDEFLCIQEGEYSDLRHHVNVFRDRVPANLLPIARDPGGNLICLSIAGSDRGKVYFWDHEEEAEEGETPGYDNVYFVADSFDDLLHNLSELPE